MLVSLCWLVDDLSLHHGLTSWANLLTHSACSCMPRLGLLKSPDAHKCLLLQTVLPHSYVQQSPQYLSLNTSHSGLQLLNRSLLSLTVTISHSGNKMNSLSLAWNSTSFCSLLMLYVCKWRQSLACSMWIWAVKAFQEKPPVIFPSSLAFVP